MEVRFYYFLNSYIYFENNYTYTVTSPQQPLSSLADSSIGSRLNRSTTATFFPKVSFEERFINCTLITIINITIIDHEGGGVNE